ncbi:MAG: T9SS type B sorting domain-containing protein [Maribacter sp.]|nr:T9SS type B sorting domain-containing protein [Maribacter sp.]NNK17773.1 T9SS type B sorting domain-containing protein [Maribacter sp.]NNK76562.1 T9SS type B sorting domain-containing protein [Maribacter sp.]
MGLLSQGQVCPTLSYPQNGSTEIPVNATITWPVVGGINGYLISLGTTPGGVDLLDGLPIGQDNFYTAPTGLPENTQIYVSISLVLFDAPPISCLSETFTTTDVTGIPQCTFLIAPDNNAANVTIVTDLTWAYSPTATGYKLSIGTVPGGNDVLNNLDVGNTLIYEPTEDLPQDAQIYIQIIPYNENGEISSCTEESFSTGGESLDCDPIVDNLSGEITYLRPEIDFPNQIQLCKTDLPFTADTDDVADGFRWFRINDDNSETLISANRNATILGPGRYRYEAYNTIPGSDGTVECSDFRLFFVALSEKAIIEVVDVVDNLNSKEITIDFTGIGNYEFALDNVEGPYQDSPIFKNVSVRPQIAYVRDKNGCGIAEKMVDRDLNLDDFPNFFTPNGDGINDFWQFVPPRRDFKINIETISIYNRYGNLIQQFKANSLGWDGNFNGVALPSSDYWFKAILSDGRIFKGHFALKR